MVSFPSKGHGRREEARDFREDGNEAMNFSQCDVDLHGVRCGFRF